jgi:hypothetical protein
VHDALSLLQLQLDVACCLCRNDCFRLHVLGVHCCAVMMLPLLQGSWCSRESWCFQSAEWQLGFSVWQLQ